MDAAGAFQNVSAYDRSWRATCLEPVGLRSFIRLVDSFRPDPQIVSDMSHILGNRPTQPRVLLVAGPAIEWYVVGVREIGDE
jgi:hypothetical protein